MSEKSFIHNAAVLMTAGLLVRLFGFIYKIYIANCIGSEGLGVYQLIFPVYSLIVLTLTSGISIAVSRLVANCSAKRLNQNSFNITKTSLTLVGFAGALAGLLLFAFAKPVSIYIIKDMRAFLSLRVASLAIPFVVMASALKGYFYGIQDMLPTAISQVVEMIVKLSFIFCMISFISFKNIEVACAVVTLAMALGEIGNLIVVYIFYQRQKRLKDAKQLYKIKYTKQILKIALPVSSNRFIISLMFAVEHLLIPIRLSLTGMSQSMCLEEYGKLCGMVAPLIFFPCLVTSSISTSLVPAIAKDLSIGRKNSANYKISKSIQLTFVLGFLFGGLFMSYPDLIDNLIYKNESIKDLLFLMSFTCIFTYMQQTLLGIMNGLEKERDILINNIIGSAIRIIIIYFLVPKMGISAYIYGIIISSGLVCVRELYITSNATGLNFNVRDWMIRPLVPFLGILVFSDVLRRIITKLSVFDVKQQSVVIIILAVLTGTIMMIITRAIDTEYFLSMLFSKKIKENKRNK